MLIFLLAIAFQAPPKYLNNPGQKTVVPGQIERPSQKILPRVRSVTAPTLSIESDFTHAQMEHELGGQGADIGELKGKVSSLEDKREKVDRPDIEELKKSRDHYLWTFSILGTILTTTLAVLAFLFQKFGRIVWVESILPRIRRVILDRSSPDVRSSQVTTDSGTTSS